MDKSEEYTKLCDELDIDSPLTPNEVLHGFETTTEDGYWHKKLCNGSGIRWIFCPSASFLIERVRQNLKENELEQLCTDSKGCYSCMIIDEKMLSVSQSIKFSSGGNDSPEKALVYVLKWQLERRD